MLKYKQTIEKELDGLKWKRISARIRKETDVDIRPDVLRKRYSLLQENGFIISPDDGSDEGAANVDEAASGRDDEGEDDVLVNPNQVQHEPENYHIISDDDGSVQDSEDSEGAIDPRLRSRRHGMVGSSNDGGNRSV